MKRPRQTSFAGEEPFAARHYLPLALSPVPKWQDALAGACAGALSKTAMAPVERVKLILQLQGSMTSSTSSAPQRMTPWKVAVQIQQTEGFWAFWRGNWPNVVRTAGQAALNLSLMDYYKAVATSPFWEQAVVEPIAKRRKTKAIKKTDTVRSGGDNETSILSLDEADRDLLKRQREFVASLVSGGLAGATSTTVLYPMEFLRTRLAMDQGSTLEARQYAGMKDAVLQTLRTDGMKGMYQGYGIAVFGSILYRLIFLGGYDALKTELLHWRLRHRSSTDGGSRGDAPSSISFAERFLVAQTVSLAAGTTCYPIDSVRRRLMMQTGKAAEERLYRGSWHCFQTIWRTEGLRGFYLGLTPNLVRSIGGALMLVAYDALKGLRRN